MQKLGDYIKEYSARNKQNEDIPVYSVTNSNGFCRDYFGKEVASSNKKTYKIVPRNAFAYNPSRINVGSVDYQHYEDRVIVSPLYNVFTVDERVVPEYLYFYLKNPNTIKRIKAVASGSVRDNLKLSMLYEFPISLPSVSNQKTIVKTINKVQAVIDSKKSALEKLDNLIKARFVEMFKGKYDSFKVGEKLKTTSGGTPKSSVSEYYDGGNIPWLTSGEVNYGDITKPSNYITEKGLNNSSAKWVPENSIVIAMYGATAGKVGIVRYKTTTNQAVCSVLPNDNFNQEFLRYAFQDISEELTSKAIGGGQPNISQAIIKNSYIVDAPIEEQERFASFAKQVDKSKFAISQSLLLLIKAFSASFISHSEQISVLLSSRDNAG